MRGDDQQQNHIYSYLSPEAKGAEGLNVAFHLAERKYATQTYGHVRTVYDLLGITQEQVHSCGLIV
jgi:hypothetical protein